MVEKRIEFYFLKHPNTELDCSWSRKGSSNYERSLIMAKTNFKPNEGHKFRKAEIAPAKRVINLSTMMDCFELDSLARAARRCSCSEIELRAIYADYREPGYNAEATMDCIQLHTFFCAVNVLNFYGYRLRMEETDGYLTFGRKAVTLTFVQEVRSNDVYPESSRSN